MVSRGKRSESDFQKIFKNKKMIPLDPLMVEDGNVYKEPVYRDSELEICFLWLGPNSGIKEHKHIKDSEIYRDIDNDSTHICNKGESHSCYNNDKENWLVILAIKKK